MTNEGRAEGRVKVCLGDRESERKSDREIKEVRRIYSNPIERDALHWGFSSLARHRGPVECLCYTTVHLDGKRQEQH